MPLLGAIRASGAVVGSEQARTMEPSGHEPRLRHHGPIRSGQLNSPVVDITTDRLAAMLEPEDPLVGSWRGECVDLTGQRLLALLRQVRVRAGLPPRGLS